jgi:hypothetical protein
MSNALDGKSIGNFVLDGVLQVLTDLFKRPIQIVTRYDSAYWWKKVPSNTDIMPAQLSLSMISVPTEKTFRPKAVAARTIPVLPARHISPSAQIINSLMSEQQSRLRQVGDVKELPSHYHATNIVPTQFTGTLSFYLRSYKEVLDLSSTVLLVGTKGDKLGFNIKYGEITFAVSIELETQLNMPEPPKEAEASEVYVVTVNLTINGYSSVAKEFPVPIILEVNEALKT